MHHTAAEVYERNTTVLQAIHSNPFTGVVGFYTVLGIGCCCHCTNHGSATHQIKLTEPLADRCSCDRPRHYCRKIQISIFQRSPSCWWPAHSRSIKWSTKLSSESFIQIWIGDIEAFAFWFLFRWKFRRRWWWWWGSHISGYEYFSSSPLCMDSLPWKFDGVRRRWPSRAHFTRGLDIETPRLPRFAWRRLPCCPHRRLLSACNQHWQHLFRVYRGQMLETVREVNNLDLYCDFRCTKTTWKTCFWKRSLFLLIPFSEIVIFSETLCSLMPNWK